MGIEEVTLLTALHQFAQAVQAYLAKIQGAATSPFAQAAIAVGGQLAANTVQAAKWGLDAANKEFTAGNTAEKTIAGQLATLPPIT